MSNLSAPRVRRRTIRVRFKQGDIWLLTTERYRLADGVTIRLRETHRRPGIAAFSTAGQFVVEMASAVPPGVVAGVIAGWLYDKLKRNRATLTMDRTEIEVDDKQKVTRFMREHIEWNGGSGKQRTRKAAKPKVTKPRANLTATRRKPPRRGGRQPRR